MSHCYMCNNKPRELILSSLLYHNLITIYTNKTKCLLLLQNLMDLLLKCTEMVYRIAQNFGELIVSEFWQGKMLAN